ncbi:hypothetical protein Dimus_011613 [Dionaea muscipula]
MWAANRDSNELSAQQRTVETGYPEVVFFENEGWWLCFRAPKQFQQSCMPIGEHGGKDEGSKQSCYVALYIAESYDNVVTTLSCSKVDTLDYDSASSALLADEL